MKRIILLAALWIAGSTAIAAEINFVTGKTWKQVLEMARQQKKMIFFDAFATWCGPCKYMDQSVYTASNVASYYNSNYINVKVDMEKGEGVELATLFNITAYPTLLFISPEGKVLHQFIGALEADEFLQLGKDAKDPSKQYFTLKTKVQSKKASDAEVSQWAAMAKKMRDDDLNAILVAFLAGKPDLLVNEHVATIAYKYADKLTDAQIFTLMSSQQKLQTLLKIDERAAWRMVYEKLFAVGLQAYSKNSSVKEFTTVVQKFDRTKANLAVKDLEFRIALYVEEDAEKASRMLADYLQATQDALTIEEIGEIFINNLEELHYGADYAALASALKRYKLKTKESGKEGWLYLMQTICYFQSGDEAGGKDAMAKAMKSTLDAEYKELLEALYKGR